MIIRVFVSPCNLKAMEEFYLKKALPILKKQRGCLLAIAAKDKDSRPPKITMVSLWKSLDDLKRFTGRDYKKPKVVPEEVPLLKGKANLGNFEIIGVVTKEMWSKIDLQLLQQL